MRGAACAIVSVSLLALGCAAGATCELDADHDAGPVDATTGPLDARVDARPTDAAACPTGVGELDIGAILLALAPGETTLSRDDPSRMCRVRLYAADGTTAVYDATEPCISAGEIGTIPAGLYDIAVDSGTFATGVARSDPARCAETSGSARPWCAASRVHVRPCASNVVVVALHCTAGCDDHAWPWE